MTRAEKICKAFEDLLDCCQEIKESEKCDGCPMKRDYLCLEDNDVITVADLLHTEIVTELIEYAERA